MNMKPLFALLLICLFSACSSSIKLSIPEAFKNEAEMFHVNGSKKNKMDLGIYTTSKIKRKANLTYPGWGRWFILENLLLSNLGLQLNENVVKQKHSYSYTINNVNKQLTIHAKETSITKKMEYRLGNGNNPFTINQTQLYQYIFSAIIGVDTTSGGKNWELLLTNTMDFSKDVPGSLFPIIRPNEAGLVTNGTDTFFIKPLIIKEVERPNGKKGWLPFKVLSGYELNGKDGVIGIIDLIQSNLWLYKELDENEKLVIAGITTAILARRVNDNQW
jgi:hypothetical protein